MTLSSARPTDPEIEDAAATAPASANIAEWLRGHAADLADHPAIRQGDVTLSYAALDAAAARAAGLLVAHGSGPATGWR